MVQDTKACHAVQDDTAIRQMAHRAISGTHHHMVPLLEQGKTSQENYQVGIRIKGTPIFRYMAY
jgi:hypothetical protein